MNHTYIPSQLESALCAVCKRGAEMHGAKAECETCNQIDKVEYYLAQDMIMCWSCKDKELASLMSSVAPKHDSAPSTNHTKQLSAAIKEIHQQIVTDESIPSNQRPYVFQQKLMERHTELSKQIFELNKQLLELQSEQREFKSALLDQGNDLRADIREQIRANDATYQPIQPKIAVKPVIKPKAKTFKQTVQDELITGYMDLKNCSRQEAERAIMGKAKA